MKARTRTKMINPEVLIEHLIRNCEANGNKTLEQRLADLTVWFYRNRKAIDSLNLERRCHFVEVSLWTMLELFALMMERVQEAEAGKKSASLWLPRELKVEGDLVTHAD